MVTIRDRGVAAIFFQHLLETYNVTQRFKIEAVFLGAVALHYWNSATDGTRSSLRRVDSSELNLAIPHSIATLDVLLQIPFAPPTMNVSSKIAEATLWLKRESRKRRSSPTSDDDDNFYAPAVDADCIAYTLFVDTTPLRRSKSTLIEDESLPVVGTGYTASMAYAKPALLLIRFLDRIKHETMVAEVHEGRDPIHSQRRTEQIRLLRLFAELYEYKAKPDGLSIRLLTDALSHPESLAILAAHYKGKTMLTNQLASQEARWQIALERKERDFARLQDLGQRNLKAFKLVRKWLNRSAFTQDSDEEEPDFTMSGGASGYPPNHPSRNPRPAVLDYSFA